MERKIALCVGNWNSDSTLFCWTYAKRYFLRKQRDADGNETLSPLDKLYIVHVTTGTKSKERWDGGGPLLPGLATALVSYPHTIVELEGSTVHSAILDWSGRENIDLLVLGSRENKNTMQKIVPGTNNIGSTSDIVKSRCKCPCLIVRPASARNDRLRIKSEANLGKYISAQSGLDFPAAGSLLQHVMSCCPRVEAEGRKVAFAFESFAYGRQMMAWAAKYCLFPDDEIYLVHCVTKSEVKREKKEGGQGVAMPSPGPPDTEEAQQTFEELQGFTVVSVVTLRGDPKQELCDFAENVALDLLISGCSSGSRLRKALTGGSVSSHLTHRAPCPTLVIPQKYFLPSSEASGNLDDLSGASPATDRSWAAGGLSLQLSGRLSGLRTKKLDAGDDMHVSGVSASGVTGSASPPQTPPNSAGYLSYGTASPPPQQGVSAARITASSDEEVLPEVHSIPQPVGLLTPTRGRGRGMQNLNPRSWRRKIRNSSQERGGLQDKQSRGREQGKDVVEQLRTEMQLKDLEIKELKEKVVQLEKALDGTLVR